MTPRASFGTLATRVGAVRDRRARHASYVDIGEAKVDRYELNARFTTDENGLLVNVSPLLAEILSAESSADLVGVSLRSLFIDAGLADRLIDQVTPKRTLRDARAELRRLDGTEIWASVSLHRPCDGECLIGTLTDVTEFARLAQDLFQSESRYRSVFLDLPTPMWELDLSAARDLLRADEKSLAADSDEHLADLLIEKLAVRDINDAARTALGLSGEERPGESLAGLIRLLGGRSRIADHVRKFLEASEPFVTDAVGMGRDGRERALTVTWIAPDAIGRRDVSRTAVAVVAHDGLVL